MEFENLIKLIEEVSASGLETFLYEEDGSKIKMEKGSVPIEITKENISVATAGREETEKGKIVKSPLVGTFYSAPSEDADPYVTVGTVVKKGQVLAIVEAMKLMNEIEAEVDGTIAEVFVENQDAVEYGQPLFRIV